MAIWNFLVFLVVATSLQRFVGGEPQVPCYFIFGDSLVDSGNNNNLQTKAKVNYPPYGIDFPGGRPTGKFCNGQTTADIIGELLGFPGFIPPFAAAKGPEILRGVNYGSGAAGILDETGKQLTLYNSGARKVAISAIGAIGCTPHSIENYETNGSFCVDYMNQAVIIFNNKLRLLVNRINSNLTGAKFVYLESGGVPISPSIQIELTECCKVNNVGQCVPFEVPCPTRDGFWDSFHPTEALNRITAPSLYLEIKEIL